MPILKIGDRQYTVQPGQTFRTIYDEHDTPLMFGCKEGICGTCKIRVLENPQNISPMRPHEQDFLQKISARPNERLACQTQVLGDVAIEIADFGMDAIFD
jgi:ferredoxin